MCKFKKITLNAKYSDKGFPPMALGNSKFHTIFATNKY